MTYLAGVCPNIDLGTAAVILPWHDPLRVAEQAAVLDLLCKGRLRLGLGRGLARREFAAFRGTMDEIRERFDEAAPMIVNALRTGVMEADGNFYPAAARGDPPAPEIQLRRAHLRRRLQRGFGGCGGATRRAHGDVLRSALADASARRSPRNREMHRKYPWNRSPADDDRRFLRLLAVARRGRGPGAQAHGQFRPQQLRSLRVAWRAFRAREGLRRLRAEGGDRPQGRHGRRDRRVHEGCRVGPARPHLRELETRPA